MPGLFKRKNRRHTVDNPEETKAAVKAAKKQISKKDIELKPGTGDQIFLDHIKNKYPNKVKQAHLHVGSDRDSISTTSSSLVSHVVVCVDLCLLFIFLLFLGISVQ